MDQPHDPYEVLGVPPDASDAAIRAAYFAQVRAHPPERDPAVFQRVRAAYDLLRDPERRRDADLLRLADWPEPTLRQAASLDTRVEPEDVVRAARALTDLDRVDWSADCREVSL